MAVNQKPPQKPQKQQQPAGNTIEELRYLQQLYQNQYVGIAQEINIAIDALRTLDNVQGTLENIDTLNGKNSLVPVGPSTYLDGKITNAKSVVIGIGAGYLVEKDIDGAKSYISKMTEKETQHINRLNKAKREIEGALMEISYKADELSHQ